MNRKKRADKNTIQSFRKTFASYNALSCVVSLIIIGIFYYFFYVYHDLKPSYYHAFILYGVLTSSTALLTTLVFMPFLKNLGIFEENMNKISNGEYKTRLPENELGVFKTMGKNFNKMADELEQNKLLHREFVHNFSHEFKTPISSIHGFSTILLEEQLNKEEQEKYLNIIKDESYRLAHLSEKALFLSKLNSQSIITDKEDYALDTQIKDVIILTQKFWEEKNIKMNVNIRAVTYHNNPELIKEIWINLLSNAIKYTKENGIIDIRLKKSGDKIIFTIADDGVGIEEEKIKYIFDEYYQTDSSRHKMGVGLGLSITKKIVDLANGTIKVESIVNKGTTFTVILDNNS